MDHGSLLEGIATIDPQPVNESNEAHLWAVVDIPASATGLPVTTELPDNLYSSVFVAQMGSATTPMISWPVFPAPAVSGHELRSCILSASGLSTEVSFPLFAFPVLGRRVVPGPPRDSFITRRDCGWDAEMVLRISQWWKPVLTRLQYLRSLSPGWDSSRARSIDQHSVDRVLSFLAMTMASNTPPPSIVPLESGGLQIEWHRAGLDVEIEFEPGDEAHFYFHELSSGEEHEGSDPVSAFTTMDLGNRLAAGYDPANVS
jgi:hypothetical protein